MNLLDLFRRSSSSQSGVHRRANLTFSETRVGHTLTRTAVLLRKNIWAWPVVAVVFLSIIGVWVKGSIESTMKNSLRSQLQTLLDVETEMMRKWYRVQTTNVEALAQNRQVRSAVYQLLEIDSPEASNNGDESIEDARQALAKALAPSMASQDLVGYFVADKALRIVDASNPVLLGQQEVPQYELFLSRALQGKSVVSSPFPSIVMMKNEHGQIRTGEPTMYVCAPLVDADLQIVGVLAMQLRPELEFTQILQIGQIGDSGETYAFDKNGVMVSNSRFDEELILLGILADHEHSRSILNVLIRDPQGNMTSGYRPNRRRAELPLTNMAAKAIAGEPGVDVEGYRDYRGVPVVGAWTWLPEYEIGIATELDVAEAYRALTILKTTFWILYGLLIACSVAIFVFTIVVARLQSEARSATVEAQQLGQYTLDEQLGSGAMGIVYRGHHAMLRRPTAIKLLNLDKVNPESIQRFESEVQVTCRLKHPSTIQIYDFGRTPDDVFYYAMEYLDGVDLQALVEQYGPQSGGRVVHVLLQACGSLFEAHSEGLVHRDIKPANIMVNNRGGVADVAKVLDFGLVKAVDEQRAASQSGGGGLTGTPLYMSPEAIQTPMSVDARSDLYSLGAVGYFLLTGNTVFQAQGLADLCQKHIDEVPQTPSTRAGIELSTELENAILSCLEKSRAKRPQTARDLAQMLSRCPEATEWSTDKAEAWWRKHERRRPSDSKLASDASSTQLGLDQTLDPN